MEPLPPLPSAEAIRQAAATVVHRPEYDLGAAERDYSSMLERFFHMLERFARFIGNLFDYLNGVSPFLAWLVVLALVAALIALLLHIAYTFRLALRGHRPVIKAGDNHEHSDEPESWELKARQAAQQQDYILALRCLLRAGLLRLESARAKRLRRGATNREYLRRFRGTPAFEPLERMVEMVDRKWYGGASCSEEDFQFCAQAYQQLRDASGPLAHAQRP